MKSFKRILLLIVIALGIAIYYNYPKLNILAGYSAKNTASSVFLAGRSLEFTDANDNNFSPINVTSDEINIEEKSATGSVYGLLKRKAVYREGLGAVLITNDFDITKPQPIPKRSTPDNNTPFPYGNADHKDTIFSNIDYKKLNETIDTIFNDRNQTRSVIVAYKDKIIAEKYDTGFTKESKQLGWSMTKSITGTLFGILKCQGKIDIQQSNLFPEWENDERKKITIHNLLQMNSGLEWEEDYNTISDVTKMLFLEKDMTKVQINKPLVGKPNETWNYSSGTTNLLAGILLKNQFTSQQEYLDFWYAELMDKIGMHSAIIESDLAGNLVGSSYGWATTRDWAKFGLLYLHKGNWNGEQIIDSAWVDYVATPTHNSDGRYGAHFWLNANGFYPDVPKDLFSANGFQGQMVAIIPSKEMVIVRFGLVENPDFSFNDFLKEITESVQ